MRGVNKLVIEVKPDDEYIEKALLFIKPKKQEISHKKISDSAENLLTDIQLYKNNEKYKNPSHVIFLLIGITAGSLGSWVILFALSFIR